MGKSLLTEKHLTDETAAKAHLEAIRWPNGPVCPHCSATKIYRLQIKSTQREVLKCASCRKQFTVTVDQMDSGDAALVFVQERHEHASAPSHAGDHLQVGVVHGSSYSSCHESTGLCR